MDVHEAGAATDHIARARKLAPLLTAAAPRIDAACELPADVLDAMHCRGHVPTAGATLDRWRRARSGDLHPVRGGNRERRCLGRMVHEPGFRLFHVGRVSRAARRTRSVRWRARRAGLGHGTRREGDPRRGRLAHHRHLVIRQWQPPRNLARRALPVLRGRRHAAAPSRRAARGNAPCCSAAR